MKQILFYILFSLFTCLTICAEPYTPESLPNVFDRTTRVANPDGLLSQAAVDSINSMLLSLDSHEVQCIVVVVNNIKGDDPYEFAMGLGRRFGVGGEKNLGIVLVLATDDRSYEMITGDGMEKFLPDIICHRIQEHTMVPLLNQKAQGELSTALGKLLAITEAYPDLKANENFKDLQVQLERTENRIKESRKEYNEAVQKYNVSVRRFPSNIIANTCGFEKKVPFQAAEGAEKAPDLKGVFDK